jgi:hypothetical protein
MAGWAAAAAAAISAIGGILGNKASGEAAKGADKNLAFQKKIYEEIRRDFAPYREGGLSGFNALLQATGLPGVQGSSQTGPAGPQDVPGLSIVSGATWAGRPVFTDAVGGLYSGRGRDWKFEDGLSYLGQASDTPNGMKFYGSFIKGTQGRRLTFSDGQYYDGPVQRGKVLGTVAQEAPAESEAPAAPTDPHGGFLKDPGYQFRMDEGEKAINRNFAARGLLGSGARGKAIQQYGQDYATGEFTNYWNRLAAIAGVGQTANQNTAQANQTLGAYGGNAIMAAGNARASGYGQMSDAAYGLGNEAAKYWAYKKGSGG